jgi:ribosomal protein S18 acetylase RimI-like enzyme
MILREYQSNDLEQILTMDNKDSKRRKDKFKVVENCDAFACYVAEEDSRIKGFVIIEDLGDGISYYISQINAAEKRKGIGRRLMQYTFERIGTGKHISLNVNSDNEEAIRFYEALGFQRSGFTRNYRKGQDKYWYERNT